MRKTAALYKNELFKILHKTSLIIILSLAVVFVFIFGVVLKASQDTLGNRGVSQKQQFETLIDSLTLSIESGINYLDGGIKFGTPLTDEDIVEFKNKREVLEYSIANNLASEDMSVMTYQMITDALLDIGMTFVLILSIILAGSSFSQEFSSGSIKVLIISPVKRWKIWCAKLMSVITVGLGSALFVFLIVMASMYACFGGEAILPYVYAKNGIAHEIQYIPYWLLNTLINYIDVFVYSMFALLLSVVARSSAVAIGGSFGAYFFGNILMTVITMTGGGQWTKFIPFLNLDLAQRIFTYSGMFAESSVSFLNVASVSLPPLIFSVFYLIILTAIPLLTSFDAFTRRDIK